MRKAKALEGLGRVAEARVVMEECVALNPKAKDYEDYLKQLVSKDDGKQLSLPLLPSSSSLSQN